MAEPAPPAVAAGADPQKFLERRERLLAKWKNSNGAGVTIAMAVQLSPGEIAPDRSKQRRLFDGPPDPPSRSTSGRPRAWSTPQAFDGRACQKGPEAEARARAGRAIPGRNGGPPSNLREQVLRAPGAAALERRNGRWPTATATDAAKSGLGSGVTLSDATLGRGPEREERWLWHEWDAQLMGYPSDWCSLPLSTPTTSRRSKRSGTRSSRRSLR